MMDIPLNLSEISAEMLLDYLYPDSGKQWVSRDIGEAFPGWLSSSFATGYDCA